MNPNFKALKVHVYPLNVTSSARSRNRPMKLISCCLEARDVLRAAAMSGQRLDLRYMAHKGFFFYSSCRLRRLTDLRRSGE